MDMLTRLNDGLKDPKLVQAIDKFIADSEVRIGNYTADHDRRLKALLRDTENVSQPDLIKPLADFFGSMQDNLERHRVEQNESLFVLRAQMGEDFGKSLTKP